MAHSTWHELIENVSVSELRAAIGTSRAVPAQSSSATVADIKAPWANTSLTTLNRTDSLRVALAKLEGANVLSAPVIAPLLTPEEAQDIGSFANTNASNASGGSEPLTEQFMGFVDVLDIAMFVLQQWRLNVRLLSDLPRERSFAQTQFFATPVSAVLEMAQREGRQANVVVVESDPVEKLLQMLADAKNAHRACVSSEEGVLIGVVSQSDIVRYASLHKSLFPDFKVDDLDLLKPPVSVRLDTPFHDVLELVCRNNFGGVALIDQEAHVDGVFSASDLRGLSMQSFEHFHKSVLDFISMGTRTARHGPTVTLSPDLPLPDLLQTFADSRVHRLFAVDEYNRARGVVTLTDVVVLLTIRHEDDQGSSEGNGKRASDSSPAEQETTTKRSRT